MTTTLRFRLADLFFLVVSLSATLTRGEELDVPKVPRSPKVPVALAWGDQPLRLYVALRDARMIAVIDPEAWRVETEWALPFRPVSLALGTGGETLLVGGLEGQAAVLDRLGMQLHAFPAGRGPTRLVPLPRRRIAIVSLWDPAVRIFEDRGTEPVAIYPLPFAPGPLVLVRGDRLVVADAFGGHLAVLDPDQPGPPRLFPFDGVGISALRPSREGQELLLVHMEQRGPVPVNEANIDQGRVLSSRLSGVKLIDLESDARSSLPLKRRQVILDGPEHGAADPSDLALSPDGTKILVALAGSHQVLKSDRTIYSQSPDSSGLLPLGHSQSLHVREVGRSPLAIVFHPRGELVVTADAMSDRLTVLKVADLSIVKTLHLSPTPLARTPAQRGEALFLDGSRSMDRWMSCASCHRAGHTNGLNFDTLGDGNYGWPKNTPSLRGVGRTEPFGWNGAFPKLADQVHQSLESSLQGGRPSKQVIDDLVAYLNTLEPPPARRKSDESVDRGKQVFRDRGCVTCHRPSLYTTPALRDVDMPDGAGNRRFNPPSLRGVAWTSPYFHDGRALSLEDVLKVHPPGGESRIKGQELADLIRFLESL